MSKLDISAFMPTTETPFVAVFISLIQLRILGGGVWPTAVNSTVISLNATGLVTPLLNALTVPSTGSPRYDAYKENVLFPSGLISPVKVV